MVTLMKFEGEVWDHMHALLDEIQQEWEDSEGADLETRAYIRGQAAGIRKLWEVLTDHLISGETADDQSTDTIGS